MTAGRTSDDGLQTAGPVYSMFSTASTVGTDYLLPRQRAFQVACPVIIPICLGSMNVIRQTLCRIGRDPDHGKVLYINTESDFCMIKVMLSQLQD